MKMKESEIKGEVNPQVKKRLGLMRGKEIVAKEAGTISYCEIVKGICSDECQFIQTCSKIEK